MTQVIDFRQHRIRRTNKPSDDTAAPAFFCVRLSWNADFIHQVCDPNDANGLTTGVVRAAIEEFWNDLKRAHFIDHATRAVTVTVAFSSNYASVRSRVTFMFEFASTGEGAVKLSEVVVRLSSAK